MSQLRVFPITITKANAATLATYKPLLNVPGMERTRNLVLSTRGRRGCSNCSQRRVLRKAADAIVSDLFEIAERGNAKALHKALGSRYSMKTNATFVIKSPGGKIVKIDENGKRGD